MQVIQDLRQKIVMQIEALGGNPELIQIVDYLYSKMPELVQSANNGEPSLYPYEAIDKAEYLRPGSATTTPQTETQLPPNPTKMDDKTLSKTLSR